MSENNKERSTLAEGGSINISGAEISRINPAEIWPETDRVRVDSGRAEALKEIEAGKQTPADSFLPLRGHSGRK